jgi:hypothetical protein
MRRKIAFIATGFLLILLSYFVQAEPLTHTEFELQPGSSYEFNLVYFLNAPEYLQVESEVFGHDKVRLDSGAVGSHYFKLKNGQINFPSRIEVDYGTAPGKYSLELAASYELKGVTYVKVQAFKVKVVERTESYYYTTDSGRNIAPKLENVNFSPSNVLLTRLDSAFVRLKFTNSGSLTDYRIHALNPCSTLEVEVLDANQFRVGEADVLIKIHANQTTEEGACPIKVYADDLGSSTNHLLGTINVLIKPIYSLNISLPVSSVELDAGEEKKLQVAVQNPSNFPQDVFISTNNENVVFEQSQISLVPHETKNLTFTVKASEIPFTARLSFDGQATRHVFLHVNMPESNLNLEGVNQSMVDITGFTVIDDTLSVVLGFIVVMILFALYWRDDIRGMLLEKLKRFLAHFHVSFKVKKVSKEEEHETVEAVEEAEEALKPLAATKQTKIKK